MTWTSSGKRPRRIALHGSTIVGIMVYPIRYWNWKTASITALLRGSVFLLALGRRGGQRGALIEITYVVATCGFFSAIQQGLLGVRPRWAGRSGIVAVVPIVALTIDAFAHRALGAPNPDSVTVSVIIFSLISAAFHLHVMENGVMLTGQRGDSFLADLRAVPGLLVSFFAAPFRSMASIGADGAVPDVEWEAAE